MIRASSVLNCQSISVCRWFRSRNPSPDLTLHPGQAWNPAVQALSAQRAQFDFCNVEPTAVLRRVVDFQSLCQLASVSRLVGRVQRFDSVRVQVVQRPGPPARPPGIASPTCPRSTGPNPVACAARPPPHGSGRSVAPPPGRSARPRCAHTHARLAPAGRARPAKAPALLRSTACWSRPCRPPDDGGRTDGHRLLKRPPCRLRMRRCPGAGSANTSSDEAAVGFF